MNSLFKILQKDNQLYCSVGKIQGIKLSVHTRIKEYYLVGGTRFYTLPQTLTFQENLSKVVVCKIVEAHGLNSACIKVCLAMRLTEFIQSNK